MKGWLANHNEDSFAKAKQGQWALLCPQQKEQAFAGHSLVGTTLQPCPILGLGSLETVTS